MIPYPTALHKAAAEKVVELLQNEKEVAAILLTCSCARGKATKDSCLDIDVVASSTAAAKRLEKKFRIREKTARELRDLHKAGRFSHLDINFSNGRPLPKKTTWTSGPDEFELELGTIYAYSLPLFEKGGYFRRMKDKYFPYYDEKLRKERLATVKIRLFNNLDHIPLYIKRKLYFQAFKRLYDASREFLQALFIKRKIYPIAYDKWIREELVEILNEAMIYKEFIALYEIRKLESNEILKKERSLRRLAKKYL